MFNRQKGQKLGDCIMDKHNRNIEDIKKEIQTAAPYMTDELLELLFEYFSKKVTEECKKAGFR